jgi:hypothetical protein
MNLEIVLCKATKQAWAPCMGGDGGIDLAAAHGVGGGD